MISLTGRKKAKLGSGSGKDQTAGGQRPTRLKIEHLRRMINAVKIGCRIRYHKEYEENSILESLVIGYRINDIFVFRQSDISFSSDGDVPRLVIRTPQGVEEIARVEKVQLVVPSAIGEEKKLDYDSRANLGMRGPFAPRTRLVLMSYSYTGEHLKLEAEVHRNQKLVEGVHAGLQVALLDVMLGTLDSHEPREHTRVEANLSVTVCKNGTENIFPAMLLDFSEKSLRLALDRPGDSWPALGKKDFVLIGMKSSLEKPLFKLRCNLIGERGDERVFEMTHIIRQGNSAPFEMIDALEIKIDLMHQ